jgi:hypothetical protein
MKNIPFLLLIYFFIMLNGCSSSTPLIENTGWVDTLVEKFQREPVGNPPQSIWRYTYRDQIVYYVPAQCCDQFSSLYDSAGCIICAPDGGITGKGDRQCLDFFEERKDEKLIWKDPRES